MIGERIKALRKERKMTQTDLADGIVTKSMLSMIENGKAEASMRSLREIAERLGVPLQALLVNPKEDELRKIVQEIEALADASRDAYEEKLIDKLLSYMEDAHDSIWKAKAMMIVSFCYAELKNREKVILYLEQAIILFERLGEKDELAMARILEAYYFLQWNRYEDAMSKIELLSHLSVTGTKPNTRIEFYMLLVFKELFYEDDSTLAMKHLEEGLEFMKSIHTYYRADDFYRLIASLAMDEGNVEAYKEAIHKARQFVEFTEDAASRLRLVFTESLNSIEHRDAKALREQYAYVSSVQLSSHYEVPKLLIQGVLHALEGNTAEGSNVFHELWTQREKWSVHSQLDQMVYLEGLLLGTELNCGDDWVEEIQSLSEKFPNNRYKKRLLKRLEKIKKEQR
ncbi:helix-turn-helix domain-containing protein [Mangrovibacillus cuniculi]|uniref:Helix-turn-helix transcriptional regulator n=1 Tax=Mangrovibacillus cuniculi TaxID=2593652 RepID=A0A7S8HFF9_9BACI|nr:helix-turn-helix transcriptional regulator [Mangrovibacillus cuniculi]QPC46778.1 helix-turn-helix transcriptional regulator [Mangrovibacillus cuniculi]